mgnify:CR=1 FL=1
MGSSYINNINDSFKSTAIIRLEYWNWINSLPGHSSIAFWSRSVDHRIICMLAINSTLGQLPMEFRHETNSTTKVNYENIRRLCRCTDKTMRAIIKEGVERGDIIKTNGQDTILRMPKRNIDDRKFIKSIGSNIMKLQFDAEKMSTKDRDNHIIKKLSEMEKRGTI